MVSNIDVANVAEILDSFVLSLHMRFKPLRICKRYFTDTTSLLSVLHMATCLLDFQYVFIGEGSSAFGPIDFPFPLMNTKFMVIQSCRCFEGFVASRLKTREAVFVRRICEQMLIHIVGLSPHIWHCADFFKGLSARIGDSENQESALLPLYV